MIHKPIKITDPINCKIRWANFRDFGVFGLHWQKKNGISRCRSWVYADLQISLNSMGLVLVLISMGLVRAFGLSLCSKMVPPDTLNSAPRTKSMEFLEKRDHQGPVAVGNHLEMGYPLVMSNIAMENDHL